MKNILLASAVALAATTVTSAELGNGLSVGIETDVNYTTGIETWKADITPSVGLAVYGLNFSVDTTFNALDLGEDDIFKGVDVKAEYNLLSAGLTAYTEVSSDSDFEFGDFTIGAKMSF
tara:strand:+ start:1221 stop:1577 length:357 start_codon:yes stop_codon:yes gene_type:complete